MMANNERRLWKRRHKLEVKVALLPKITYTVRSTSSGLGVLYFTFHQLTVGGYAKFIRHGFPFLLLSLYYSRIWVQEVVHQAQALFNHGYSTPK